MMSDATLDPALSALEGPALLAEVRARTAEALRGLAGSPYESALAALPEPMRVVHAIDELARAIDETPDHASIDRLFVARALEAFMQVGLHHVAVVLAGSLGTARSVPRKAIAEELLPGGRRGWDRALAEHLERHRTFRH